MYFIWYVYKSYNDQSSKCVMIKINNERYVTETNCGVDTCLSREKQTSETM